MIKSAPIVLVLAISFVCAVRGDQADAQSAATPTVLATIGAAEPLEQRLGWVDNSCLAIANKALAVDAWVAVVSLFDKTTVLVDGRVVGATNSREICRPLRGQRRSSNVGEGLSFYELELSQPVKSGVGVIGPVAHVGAGLDVDGDGRPETFTQCVTSEGVAYQVWRDVPYQGKPLWSGYDYLGYDTEWTCPPVK